MSNLVQLEILSFTRAVRQRICTDTRAQYSCGELSHGRETWGD